MDQWAVESHRNFLNKQTLWAYSSTFGNREIDFRELFSLNLTNFNLGFIVGEQLQTTIQRPRPNR